MIRDKLEKFYRRPDFNLRDFAFLLSGIDSVHKCNL